MHFCNNRRWIALAVAMMLLALLAGRAGVTHAQGEAENKGIDTGKIVIRAHEGGYVKVTDSGGKEKIVNDGELSFDIPAHSYIRVDAIADDTTQITVDVLDENGLELEPSQYVTADCYAKEITVSEVTKIVDVTFGKTAGTQLRAKSARSAASEKFPETGDRFTGVFTVLAVDGGDGHTVHGVTVGSFTGILAGEGTAEVDCSQHGAAAPVEGMKYNYTYTVLSTDKQSGTVKGNIFATSQTLAAVGTPGEEGYQRGYQSLSGVFNIHRDYNGKLTLKKSSSNPCISDNNKCYSLAGAVYGVYTDQTCTEQTGSLTVRDDGTANTLEVPVGRYYIREITAPAGYALDTETYATDVVSDQTAVVQVKDLPQNVSVKILLSKTDSETGENVPQGSASLKDAEFSVKYYDGYYDSDPHEQGIDASAEWVFKTDEDGRIIFGEDMKVSGPALYKNSKGENVFPLGTVTVQEIKAPTGYLIDDTVQVRKLMPSGTLETISTFQKIEAEEDVIRGDLQIVKFRETPDESNGQKPALEGIVFEITSKTTGEKVEIVTDENGYASTRQLNNVRGGLPYDSYIVHEKNTPSGLVQVGDFEVTILEEGQTLYYILEDDMVVAPVRLVKTDADSGQPIPVSGSRFRLLDENKNPIKMTTYYPDKVVHEIFETDEGGTFVLPEKLPAGVYYFREVQAPEGYLLSREDIRFEITENHEWDHPMEIEFPDRPAMGRIHLTKKDEENGKLLSGACFTVTAMENIVTPDGTLRAEKGEVVDTIITDSRGEAQTKELFLGAYRLQETEQPAGYVLNESSWDVDLSYQEQYTEIVLEKISVSNVPTEIVIEKTERGSSKHIPGVKFAVWNKEMFLEMTDSQMGIKETVITGDDGKVSLKYLNPGTYCVEETDPVPGYVSCDGIYEFTVGEDGRINGKEKEIIKVENDATTITETNVHNIADGSRMAVPGLVEAVDVVSLENLQPGESYRLKGLLVNRDTGKPLKIQDGQDNALVMSEVEFTAEDSVMEVEVPFTFDASELEGWTLSVFEYLYQGDVEISSHTDLDDIKQQLHIRIADLISHPVETPRTGVDEKIRMAATGLGVSAAVTVAGAVIRRRRGKDKKHFTLR